MLNERSGKMSELKEYKCPVCGAFMKFDSKSQKMSCEYCGTEMEVEAFKDDNTFTEEKVEKQQEYSQEQEYWQENEMQDMRLYICDSCGGQIIADKTTGATSCPYCESPVVMKGQFIGDLKPNYVIPFKKNKEEAKEAYHQFLKDKSFLPKRFKEESHIDEMKGIYVPFWLFDTDVKADITYDARTESSHTKKGKNSDTRYITTNYYHARRAGNIAFEHVPADGSIKMDDALMDSIEPFSFDDAVPFQSAYLSGYLAERYDVSAKDCFHRIENKMKQSAREAVNRTMMEYSTKMPINEVIDIKNEKHVYALYPVWMLTTTWNGKSHIFAMNGQTGKVVGSLPVSKEEFWKYVFTRALLFGPVVSLIIFLIFMVI